MTQSHYSINVAEDRQDMSPYKGLGMKQSSRPFYVHLFNTGETITNKEDGYKVMNLLKQAFPEPKYKVDMTYWEILGHNCPEI